MSMTVEVEVEEDGRWLAVGPRCLAYGADRNEAIAESKPRTQGYRRSPRTSSGGANSTAFSGDGMIRWRAAKANRVLAVSDWLAEQTSIAVHIASSADLWREPLSFVNDASFTLEPQPNPD